MKKIILILIIAAGTVVQAQLLFYENFAAVSGSGNGVAWHQSDVSGVWSSGYTGSEAPLTSSGDLFFSGLQPSAGGGKISVHNPNQGACGYAVSTGAFSVTNGSIYHSFLLRVTDFSGINTGWNASSWFISLRDTAGYNVAGLRSDGSGGGYLMFAYEKSDLTAGPSDPQCSAEIPLEAGRTYLVVTGVAHVETSYEPWKIWINPVSLGGTAPAETTAAQWRSYSAAVKTIYIGSDERPGSGESVFTSVYVDEFRAGRTYADVTPEDPTPRATLFLID